VIFLRAIAAALIVLGCAAFSQMCLITSMVPEPTVDCCQQDEPVSGEPGKPECAECVTLENGVDRIAPQRIALSAPVAVWDDTLFAALALLARHAEAAPALDTSPPVALSPIWHFVARTSLPVRGPSLLP
jgi:hypothetical protein